MIKITATHILLTGRVKKPREGLIIGEWKIESKRKPNQKNEKSIREL